MKIKIFISVLLFFILTSLIYAEDKVKLNFSVGGGLSNPVGENGE